jgi:pimeloyl-ACP methyl ester carboxylesterase
MKVQACSCVRKIKPRRAGRNFEQVDDQIRLKRRTLHFLFRFHFGNIYLYCYTTHTLGHIEYDISANATLKERDIKSRLKDLRTPSQLICGSDDTMDPSRMDWKSKEVIQGRFLQCPNSGYIAQYETPEVYFPGLVKFLKE